MQSTRTDEHRAGRDNYTLLEERPTLSDACRRQARRRANSSLVVQSRQDVVLAENPPVACLLTNLVQCLMPSAVSLRSIVLVPCPRQLKDRQNAIEQGHAEQLLVRPISSDRTRAKISVEVPLDGRHFDDGQIANIDERCLVGRMRQYVKNIREAYVGRVECLVDQSNVDDHTSMSTNEQETPTDR
jgi:hypothetical protein